MKITTFTRAEWNARAASRGDGYGCVDEMPSGLGLCSGGGPSPAQNQAASSEAAATTANTATQQQMLGDWQSQYNKINPYATSRLNNGLPFYSQMQDYAGGPSATAYAPANAAVMRNYRAMGSAAPNGSMQQTLANVGNARAGAFDSQIVGNQLTNEQAKNNAAAMLTGQQQAANPLGWSGAVTQGNNSIMQAPLASQGLSGLFGGLAQGAGTAVSGLASAGFF